MKRIFYILIGIIILSFSSCGALPSADPGEPRDLSIIPGECLNSTVLQCYMAYADKKGNFKFGFDLDLSVKWETIHIPRPNFQRAFPDDVVFNQFGVNSSLVKNELDAIWNDVGVKIARGELSIGAGFGYNNAIRTGGTITTFFMKDGIHLTANKDFAGVEAGEDLSGLISHPVVNIPDGLIPFTGDFEWENMLLLGGEAFLFAIPLSEFETVSESIEFTLSIPIKSAQYLTWLNDRLTDENAQMTWKDEVLTCTFTSNVGLRKKTE